MIKTTAMILDELRDYKNPATKLMRLVRDGVYIPIVRGLYETDRRVSPHCLAASIYSPSYVSFDYALSYHGLIPEAAYSVTSATYRKGKGKQYVTPFGTFLYRDTAPLAFPVGILILEEGEYAFRMANREKALCDKLYSLHPVKNIKEMESLLLEDLRIEEEDLLSLDLSSIERWEPLYRSTNVRKLIACLKRLRRHRRR